MSCCFPFGRNRTNRKVGVSRGPNPFILLVVGIDGVGKTSMVMRLRGGKGIYREKKCIVRYNQPHSFLIPPCFYIRHFHKNIYIMGIQHRKGDLEPQDGIY